MPVGYMLRTCAPDLTSYGGFQWPESGPVEAPDWDPSSECGGGLHGLADGEGGGYLPSNDTHAKWLVVKYDTRHAVDLGDKVKIPRGTVVHCGDRESAIAFLRKKRPHAAIVFSQVVVGDYGTATAGDLGTATAGDLGTATAGYEGTATTGRGGTATAGHEGTATTGRGGTATAGDHGTATTGRGGTATAGDHGTATAGNHGTATTGRLGTATAGDHGTATTSHGGTATAGNHGTAITDDHGTAIAGDHGTATAGNGGTATAGNGGVILIKSLTGVCVGVIGEKGLLPNVPYKLNYKGQFVKAV